MYERTISSLIVAAILFGVAIGCSTKPPSRDHIPELRQRLFQLQQALSDRNRAAIDSLLSLQILDIKQNSDSLLRFIYGPNNDYPFRELGNYEIFYTEDKARIDCAIMDSTGLSDRSATFTLVREHEMWLFKRFEPKMSDSSIVGE